MLDFAALGGALGAVLSRKAYAIAFAADEHPDPGTTGYQRVLGGALVPAVILLVAKWRSARAHGAIGYVPGHTRQSRPSSP